MPTYQYTCKKCDLIVEKIHPMDQSPELTCPNCEQPLTKLFGLAGVAFKGGGWGSSSV